MPDSIKGETVMSVTAMTVTVFGFFMPSIQDVRKAYREEKSDEVNTGIVLAGSVIVGSAVVAGLVSGNWNRVGIATMAVGLFAVMYYYQLGDNNGIPTISGIFPSGTA